MKQRILGKLTLKFGRRTTLSTLIQKHMPKRSSKIQANDSLRQKNHVRTNAPQPSHSMALMTVGRFWNTGIRGSLKRNGDFSRSLIKQVYIKHYSYMSLFFFIFAVTYLHSPLSWKMKIKEKLNICNFFKMVHPKECISKSIDWGKK